MKWFDGFPFKSREQLKKQQQEYEQRILPLGEAQRQQVLGVLRQLYAGTKWTDSELLYLFFNAKEQFLEGETPEDGLALAAAGLAGSSLAKKLDTKPLLALVQLDAPLTSLDAYPTAEQVRSAAVLL